MSTQDSEMLEQQRRRKKRVARMKTTIVMTIAIWMLVSLIAIITLTVCVIKLNSKMDKLEREQNQLRIEKSVSNDSDSAKEDDSISTESSFADVVTGIDSDDNMAGEGDEHKVYLTFDSVPSDNTKAILSALDEAGVKATFFVSGDGNDDARDICKKIADGGHTLGMHSFSNQYSLIYNSKDSFEDDYEQISDYLYDITGKRSVFYRFPGGSGNEISNLDMAEFVNILNGHDVTYFDWNISAGDTASDYTTEDLVANITEGVEKYKTSVILLHDDKSKTVTAESIGAIVSSLEEMGAQILPIDKKTYVVQYIKADSVE